jgi:hypothetical protein
VTTRVRGRNLPSACPVDRSRAHRQGPQPAHAIGFEIHQVRPCDLEAAAGAYEKNPFGRGPACEITVRSGSTPQEDWRLMIRDHHQGYSDWDQFTANGMRPSANRINADVVPGPSQRRPVSPAGYAYLWGLRAPGERPI